MQAPIIHVGILTQRAITFTFNQEYVMVEDGAFLKGEQRAIWIDGKIVFNRKRSFSERRTASDTYRRENRLQRENV